MLYFVLFLSFRLEDEQVKNLEKRLTKNTCITETKKEKLWDNVIGSVSSDEDDLLENTSNVVVHSKDAKQVQTPDVPSQLKEPIPSTSQQSTSQQAKSKTRATMAL